VTLLLHEVLGEIEFDPEAELNEWESRFPWAGGLIDVDLSFDGTAMDESTLDRLARYVADLAAFDRKARAAMRANADEEGSIVRDYLEFHLEELGIDVPVTALRLVRVGLYTAVDDLSEHEAVFDYSIDPEETQYLVVVKFDESGSVDEICMES
jgi:hypothetical protein